jgi:hypothetical protein
VWDSFLYPYELQILQKYRAEIFESILKGSQLPGNSALDLKGENSGIRDESEIVLGCIENVS